MFILGASMALAVTAGVAPGRIQIGAPECLPEGRPASDWPSEMITTVMAYSIDCDESTGEFEVASTPHQMGWKICPQTDEENGLALYGNFYGEFCIPVVMDPETGEAYFETGVCLAVSETSEVIRRIRHETVKGIYAVPIEYLNNESDVQWLPVSGMVNADGTAHFDGNFAFLIETVVNEVDVRNESLISTDTTWTISPLFRDINVRKPNGIHMTTMVMDADVAHAVTQSGHQAMLKPGYSLEPLGHGGLVPKPIDPRRPLNNRKLRGCLGGSSKHDGLKSDDFNAAGAIGPNSLIPRGPGRPHSIVGETRGNMNRGNGNRQFEKSHEIFYVNPGNHVITGFVPKGPGKPHSLISNSEGTLNGTVSMSGDSGNQSASCNIMGSSGIIESVPIIEPVYITQSPEDGTIGVYNLYGTGFVQNVFIFYGDGSLELPEQLIGYDSTTGMYFCNGATDLNTMALGNPCELVDNGITWGNTIPYNFDAVSDFYYSTSTLTFTDGSQFIVPQFDLGDVNSDGNHDIADVTALIDRLVNQAQASGTPVAMGTADVNMDHNLDIADVTALIDMLIGGN